MLLIDNIREDINNLYSFEKFIFYFIYDFNQNDKIIRDLLELKEEVEPFPKPNKDQVDNVINCIKRVFYGYYDSKEDQLSNLFYNLVKNHYLSNGNKRLATVIVLFLISSSSKVSIKEYNKDEFRKKVYYTAESKPENKDATICNLKKWFIKILEG